MNIRENNTMKSFVLAFAVMAIISVGASVILNGSFQKNVDQAYATQSTRVH